MIGAQSSDRNYKTLWQELEIELRSYFATKKSPVTE